MINSNRTMRSTLLLVTACLALSGCLGRGAISTAGTVTGAAVRTTGNVVGTAVEVVTQSSTAPRYTVVAR